MTLTHTVLPSLAIFVQESFGFLIIYIYYIYINMLEYCFYANRKFFEMIIKKSKI